MYIHPETGLVKLPPHASARELIQLTLAEGVAKPAVQAACRRYVAVGLKIEALKEDDRPRLCGDLERLITTKQAGVILPPKPAERTHDAPTKPPLAAKGQIAPSSPSREEIALAFAASRFRIFPCGPNSKQPWPGCSWTSEATSDPDLIRAMFRDHPNCNYGVAFSPGQFAIDPDNKGDRDGAGDLVLLEVMNGPLPATTRVKTPHGTHIYFKGDAANSVGKQSLGGGIDVRGQDPKPGYCVGPGSMIDGQAYELIDTAEMAEAPAWLLALTAKQIVAPAKRAPGVDVDAPHEVASVREYLTRLADQGDVAEAYHGGNQQTYELAQLAIDHVSPAVALELLAEVWNPRCRPPWSQDELAGIVANAAKYRQNEIGSSALPLPSVTFAGHNLPAVVEPDPALADTLAQAVKNSEALEKTWADAKYTADIEAAERVRLADFLAIFNDRFSLTMIGSATRQAKIVEFEHGGKRLRFQDLESFALRFRNLRVWLPNASGKPTWQEVSVKWLNWPPRRQYFGDGLVFAPGKPLEWDGGLNRWRGFAIQPKPGDWTPLRDLMDRVLCGGDKALSEYIWNWLAHLVQRPGVLTKSCLVFRSEHEGAGKGLFGHTIGSILGRNFRYIQRGKDVTGQFNATMAECLFATLDEAMYAGDHEASEILKTLISDQDRRSEEKYLPIEMIPNHLNTMILGNNDWMVRTGLKNRRMVYIDVPEIYTPFDPYWKQFWVNEPNPEHPGVIRQLPPLKWRQAMLHDLLARDISTFNPTDIPHTAEEGRQKLLSQPGLTAFIQDALQERMIGFYATDGYWATNTSRESAGQTSRPHHAEWIGNEPLIIICKDLEAAVRRHCKDFNVHGTIPQGAHLARALHKLLPGCIETTRPRTLPNNPQYRRCYQFANLADCRAAFDNSIGVPQVWEDADP